jgi:hypothetical protein
MPSRDHSTLFLTDERTFWHSTGVQALFLPIGDWVEPPSSSYGADTPGSKRRLVNLVRAAGFDTKLTVSSAPSATRDDLLRVHPASYVDAFKQLSDAGGGELGLFAPFSKGGYEIATLSAGLAIDALDAVLTGRAATPMRCAGPPGITAWPISPWASACSPTSRSPSKRRRRGMASARSRCSTGTSITATARNRSSTIATTC